MNYFDIMFWVVLFIISCGITVKKFIYSDKNKGQSLFVTITTLISLILAIF